MTSDDRAESAGARLGPLEQQVMDLLWDSGSHTVREVMDQLPSRPAYTTIATVMTNLDRKGFVVARRQGRSVQYEPRIAREEHTAALMSQALSVSRDRRASILHFVDSMPDEERGLLRAYLDDEARRSDP
ncbi:BlaI/MecI/CopY family transcriptional regulator [Nesterenkonia sp. NBAIMH1]|uniref:BlaI/MecI/CopY family transcriptional regulator n=1 Tax=Nesterenkonia sp. NBAIMH1 TaxID=2600320 RepID=UPI0011B5D5B4|nr:BlaI/MecI/CopY family transcriptional regulator [Nesterenkonia sp. NBAIMH1]